MKNSRKYLAGVVAAGFVVAAGAAPSHAFTSDGKQALAASTKTGGVGIISIASAVIKNISDNGTVATIGWTNTSPGWQVSTQYIDMVSSITTTSGGIQYYTDNTNSAASPKWNVAISSVNPTPAGLLDPTGTQKLPTAWRASTFTLTGVNPINPNGGAGESFLWFFHEDHAQVAVPSLNAAKYVDADPFVTVYCAPSTTLTDSLGNSFLEVSGGIHFAQSPTSFGGFQQVAHTFLYTEADFSSALAQTTYATNELVLEAFSL
jgi:hypothetical protein